VIANTWSGLTVCSRDSVEIAPVLGLWCAGTRMARWQRDGLDKSEARADAPCGGVAVAGSSTTMRRRETLRWRWRPDRMTVRWRRAAQMLGPLLGRVAIHSWRQGGTAWSLLVAREKPTAGMRRRRPSWRGSGGRSDTWRHRAWRVCWKHRAGRFGGSSKTAPELGFGSFPKTAPVKIPEGRVATSERLRQFEANLSESSRPLDGLQCIFSCFAPTGLLV